MSRSNNKQKQQLLISLGVVIALVCTTGFALLKLMEQTNVDTALLSLKEASKNEANSINAQLEVLISDMQNIAKRYEVINAVSDKGIDEAEIATLVESIRENARQATQVELIPFGKAENYPLSFAELEQVKQTEKGVTMPAEAILSAEGDWRFIISLPIWGKTKEAVDGTLFMSYNLDRIKLAMQAFDHNHGSSSLVQTFEGLQSRVIFTAGDFPPKIVEDNMVPVTGTRWQILFTPSDAFYAQQGAKPELMIAILAALGVALGIMIIFILRSVKISTGHDIFLGAGVHVASAKTISKGGKADAATVSALATQATRSFDDELNEISDPMFQHDGGGMGVTEVGDADEYESPSASENSADTSAKPVVGNNGGNAVNPVIFRDYDIRGDAQLYLTNDAAYAIGQAIGSEAQARGQTRLAVAADGRTSSPRLKEQLINGILSTGAHVIDIGSVPSPVLYFVTASTDITSGVVVTASHNPASDNGFKIILNGETLADQAIQSLQNRITTGNLSKGQGTKSTANYTDAYIEKITSDIALADTLKIVIDCGNGIAGEIAPRLLQELGCEVIPLFCDVDGNFPNHTPDPSTADNLKWLIDKVKSEKADLGIALDGDGDRLVAISNSGKIVLPDRLLMLFAKDIVSRNPGTDVIFDVKCTRRLNNLISGYGGRPLIWKSGHAHIKAKMKETGAMLGGELSGHIFFKERWYGFDDGMYAAARLLEILCIRGQTLDAALSTLPVSAITPEIRVPIAEEEKFAAVEKLIKQGDFSGGKFTTIDGLRVDFAKGWGLVRASNTGAFLTLRFEADNDEMLDKIRELFRVQIKALLPNVSINF